MVSPSTIPTTKPVSLCVVVGIQPLILEGKVGVGVKVMVGESVMVGVKVMVGESVIVGVFVIVGVKVDVGVNVVVGVYVSVGREAMRDAVLVLNPNMH